MSAMKCNDHKVQKRVLNPLELELQAIVSYPVWVTGSGPLPEQPSVLMPEPSLQLLLLLVLHKS